MLDKKKNKDKNSNYIKRKVVLSLSLALATTSSIVLNSSNALIKAETLQEDKADSLKSSTNNENKDQDPSANIVFENPNKDDLQTLSDTLKNLPELVENNKKINDMDTIGDSKNVKEGEAKKIKEFAGWTSVNNGDFIIARKTKDGIFPLSMINTTIDDIVWLKEQALDRESKYMLLLTETRTRINLQLPSCDGTPYQYLGEGPGVARALKGYDGIEKTFKAYSKENGSFAKVSFKTGYTGDMDGRKANYKVEIFAISNGKETPKDPIYTVSFDPSRNISNDKMTVKKAEDGKGIRDKIKISQSGRFTNPHITRKEFIGKDKAEEEIAKKENRPNGKAGSFESAEIELPKGIDSYKVRISCADSRFTGMSYQAWDEKYALPITGLDFSITQNTRNVAKMLLSKIYDKLMGSKEQDIFKKTPDSIKKYEDKLKEIKTLLDSTELKSTSDYKKVLNDVLEIKDQLVLTETMAINEIERVAKEKIEEIKNNKNLSEKEKNDIIEKINNKKQKAIEEIKKAKDNAEVLQKQTSWVEEINKINPVAKEEARNKIALELAKKEKEIDENTSLTQEEKKSAKAKAKEKADAGLAVIDEQKDSYDTKEEKEQAENKIKQATETAVEEINKINPVAKEEARNKIALELAKKEKEIDENTSLTEDEKKSAKAKAKEKADAGLAVIDEQKDSYDTKEEKEQAENKIKQATETAVEEINKINPVAKEEARNKIALELAKKEKEIDENTSLTQEEKKSAKAKAKEKADAGLAVINEQKDSYDTKEEKEQAENKIKQATETAIEEINKINPVAKEEARNKIALELAKKEKEIDENTSLTEKEKESAKAKAKEKADAGLAVINEQKDSYDTKEEKEQAENKIKQATETAIEEIDKINPVGEEKNKSKKKSKKKIPKTSIASLPIYPKLLAISVTLLSVIGIKKRKK